MSNSKAARPDLSQALPLAVLSVIFEKLPLAVRLKVAATVCKRWKAAAAQSTQCLQLHCRHSQARSNLINEWISNQGQHLTALHLSYYQGSIKELPCSKLLSLQLDCCTVQLGPSPPRTDTPKHGILHDLTSLQQLSLTSCHVLDSPCSSISTSSTDPSTSRANAPAWMPAQDDSAQQGPAKLQRVSFSNISSCIPDNTWKCLQHVLVPHLLTLTHLSFKEVTGVKGLRQHMTDLERLQDLHIDTPKSFLITTATAPGLSRITTLTSLKLRTCVLQLSILSSLRNLRELDLSCVGEHRPTAQPANDGILDVIAALTNLQRLRIKAGGPKKHSITWPQYALYRYAALTTSSFLQELSLEGCDLPCYPPTHGSPLSRAWQHIFPADRQLPALTSVTITLDQPPWAAPEQALVDANPQLARPPEPHPSVLTAGDIMNIAQCCPNLTSLQVSIGMHEPEPEAAAGAGPAAAAAVAAAAGEGGVNEQAAGGDVQDEGIGEAGEQGDAAAAAAAAAAAEVDEGGDEREDVILGDAAPAVPAVLAAAADGPAPTADGPAPAQAADGPAPAPAPPAPAAAAPADGPAAPAPAAPAGAAAANNNYPLHQVALTATALALSELTSLRDLHVRLHCVPGGQGWLQQLTALTNLTQFKTEANRVVFGYVQAYLPQVKVTMELRQKAASKPSSSVHEQLQERLDSFTERERKAAENSKKSKSSS